MTIWFAIVSVDVVDGEMVRLLTFSAARKMKKPVMIKIVPMMKLVVILITKSCNLWQKINVTHLRVLTVTGNESCDAEKLQG